MADEPKKDQPEDIESILSDLDAILATQTDAQAAAPAPAPIPVPKAVEPPPPPPPAPQAPQVVVDSPKAAPASQGIELAPREGIIPPPPPKPAPPKPPAPKLPEQRSIELSAGPTMPEPKAKPVEPPVEAPKAPPPIEAPKAPPAPTAVPVPAPVVAATKIEELPPETPKEQIRRVAYIYTASSSEVKGAFVAFLSQSARTISKKPLYLREVLSHEVGAASDPNAIVQKSLQVKASAILAVVEDWPPSKVDELSEACSRANLLFRSVAAADAQKKSTAVDIIVDMMLLPGES